MNARSALQIVAMSLALSGCVSDGMTPAQVAAVQDANAQNLALARAHKITFAEAAARANAAAAAASGGQLSENQVRINAFRAAVYSMVDAGQITPEVAEYQIGERQAALVEAKRQQRAAAIQDMSDSLARANADSQQRVQMQALIQAANRPVVCNTTAAGAAIGTIVTTCH